MLEESPRALRSRRGLGAAPEAIVSQPYIRTPEIRARQSAAWTPEKRALHAERTSRVMASPGMRRRIAEAKLAERNPNWGGDGIKLGGLHDWVQRRLPRPSACSSCDAIGPVDLANISQNYLRDLSDWEWLCRMCHMTKDGRRDALVQRNLMPWPEERRKKLGESMRRRCHQKAGG